MGRGSLAGWLRSVLAQRFVDRCRVHSKETSLDEQMDAGVAFAAAPEGWTEPDDRVARAIRDSLGELDAEERFLLSAYYLDGQKLAEIGKQLSVHESTVSRKLDKLTGALRKHVRKRLLVGGLDIRACDELLHDLDVRDVNVDVRATLQQETKMDTF
jgi:RNA polymerase sigma-70 factor (ECF subfamily)